MAAANLHHHYHAWGPISDIHRPAFPAAVALAAGASKLGLPVSTTHVAFGALLGIGVVVGQAHWSTIGQIALAWWVTLPLAGVLGALAMATLA